MFCFRLYNSRKKAATRHASGPGVVVCRAAAPGLASGPAGLLAGSLRGPRAIDNNNIIVMRQPEAAQGSAREVRKSHFIYRGDPYRGRRKSHFIYVLGHFNMRPALYNDFLLTL